MTEQKVVQVVVPDDYAGQRLDIVLTKIFPDYSRSRLQDWVKKGLVTVDGGASTSKTKMTGGESIELRPEVNAAEQECVAQDVPLDVRYQDDHIYVINKPANLVMHPAAGNYDGTVQNGLLYMDATLAAIPRAGIVHRLDKDTTGLFVVARTLLAHKSLVEQLQEHSVKREYLAVVNRIPVTGATIDKPIGRHPIERKRMAIRDNGKPAITHYKIEKRFKTHCLLAVQLETGRTHQIRVHMASVRHPLLGDVAYGGKPRFPPESSDELRALITQFKRQALHARKLTLQHPFSGEIMSWEAEIPDDMQNLIAALEAHASLNAE